MSQEFDEGTPINMANVVCVYIPDDEEKAQLLDSFETSKTDGSRRLQRYIALHEDDVYRAIRGIGIGHVYSQYVICYRCSWYPDYFEPGTMIPDIAWYVGNYVIIVEVKESMKYIRQIQQSNTVKLLEKMYPERIVIYKYVFYDEFRINRRSIIQSFEKLARKCIETDVGFDDPKHPIPANIPTGCLQPADTKEEQCKEDLIPNDVNTIAKISTYIKTCMYPITWMISFVSRWLFTPCETQCDPDSIKYFTEFIDQHSSGNFSTKEKDSRVQKLASLFPDVWSDNDLLEKYTSDDELHRLTSVVQSKPHDSYIGYDVLCMITKFLYGMDRRYRDLEKLREGVSTKM